MAGIISPPWVLRLGADVSGTCGRLQMVLCPFDYNAPAELFPSKRVSCSKRVNLWLRSKWGSEWLDMPDPALRCREDKPSLREE
jgi:hypothetical protein